MIINLETKFTSVNFEKIVSNYWKESFEAKNVEFDMSILQWIAIEQITFLISWINSLANLKIKVTLRLPEGKTISSDSKVYEKRQLCVNHLLIDWAFLELLNKEYVNIIDGDIKPSRHNFKGIPYREISTFQYNAQTFDSDFYDLYETSFKNFKHYIEKQIKNNTLLNYFDNHYLHYSLIKEFYSNACQHAYEDARNGKCFVSLSSNASIQTSYENLLKENLAKRYSERPKEEHFFFQDSNGEFINTAFIEFNFSDFGKGISKTLLSKYLSEDHSLITDKLGKEHFNQNMDTRVLEYAFLLFTSQYELGKDFEMHDYIPRGLYIIKDIVKRYNGMVLARSLKGKVVFNYNNNGLSDEIIYRGDDFDVNISDGFPGTSITIILPAKGLDGEHFKDLSIEIEDIKMPKPSIINLLAFTTEVSSFDKIISIKNEAEKKIRFYEEFFKLLTTQLLNLESPNGDILLFDFAGIERGSQDIYSKFIYFLAYCPLISDKVHVALFNVVEKGINQALLRHDEDLKKSKGFFTKPIPCIYPDLSVDWIGVNNTEFERKITDVWKLNDSKNELTADIHHLTGSILTVFTGKDKIKKFKIQIQSYFAILEIIAVHHKDFIKKELSDEGIQFKELKNDEHNYNRILNLSYDKDRGVQRAFLTANGKYQKEFLTFIEKLYIREYRRLISIYFLFNLCLENSSEERKKELGNLNKILTVTLSSQLLGKEFTEIINELEISKNKVSLIPLSNYYDFNTEEPFNEIQKDDSIIVVNDVISTGNLSKKIINSVTERNASIFGILTIIDSRTEIDEKNNIDSKITSLNNRIVEKFPENPFSSNPIWINPILNAPTTMSREKSNKDSILKTPQEFINFFVNDNIFKIGHFLQNTRHLTYYLQSDEFLKEEQNNGFPVLMSMIDALKDKILSEKQLQQEINKNIFRETYLKFSNWALTNSENESVLRSLSMRIESFLKEANDQQFHINDQVIDFIFYPFMSSISEIEKNLNPISLNLRGDHSIEIYPLPRIMTPRGWRFSFPPKFLNFHTEGKTALILDDGSCTGETIIQMIDSLSFLELNEIIVLSIFGRLEDFQREFLSRIKQIKVRDKNAGYKVIPVSIYFGTHFHIPIFNKITHPSHSELKEMDEVISLYQSNESVLPSHLKNYIEIRRSELLKPISPRNSEKQSSIIPKEVYKRLMFVIRDIVGNYDSYRLFKEDEIGFNDQTSDTRFLRSLKDILKPKQGKLALIAVLIHEPYLIDTIKRIYPEIINDDHDDNNLTDFIIREFQPDKNLTLPYITFYLRGLYKINPQVFFNSEFLYLVLDEIQNIGKEAINTLNGLGYFFTTIFLKTNQSISSEYYFQAKLVIQKIYLNINDLGLHDRIYSSLIKELYNESLIAVDDFPYDGKVKQLYQIQQYYKRQVSNHDGKSYSSHPNYYAAFESIINRLGVYTDNVPDEKDKDELYRDLLELVAKTKKRLFTNLIPVLRFLEPLYLNYDFNIDIPEHIKSLNQFEKLESSLKNKSKFKSTTLDQSNMPSFLNWLERFNEMFFHLKSELPLFFINSKTNLKNLIQNTINEHLNLKRITNIKIDNIPDNIFLEIHPYLLRVVFYELIENKFKHANNSDASISYEENNKSIKIKYFQNGKFEHERNENGLITIRNIIKHCGGLVTSKTQPSYLITIDLPLQIKSINR